MPSALIKIATFETPLQAHIARNKLLNAGIDAVVSNESLATTAWYLTNAVGGVPLHVRAEDQEVARKVLEEQESIDLGGTSEREWESSDLWEPQDSLEDREEVTEEGKGVGETLFVETEADRLARRALRAALLGVLFLPLQVYSIWLLLLFLFEPTRASVSSRCQVAGAWFTDLTVMAFLIQLLFPGVR